MRTTAAADHLYTAHIMAKVHMLSNRRFIDGLIITWPAVIRIKLACRIKQGGITSYAMVNTFFCTIPILTTKRTFCALLSADMIRMITQMLTPLLFRFYDFTHNKYPRKPYVEMLLQI